MKIKQVDESINVNRQKKKKAEDEISVLRNQLKNYEQEYNRLYSHKQFLGKEIYGEPEVRKELIRSGSASKNLSIREAAEKLSEENKDVKWDKEVEESLINICVYIDAGISKIRNWNISSIMYKIGKFGYESIDNCEGVKDDR